jgi:hypothetical protein
MCSFQPHKLDQDWILQENFMITFSGCVYSFPFQESEFLTASHMSVYSLNNFKFARVQFQFIP